MDYGQQDKKFWSEKTRQQKNKEKDSGNSNYKKPNGTMFTGDGAFCQTQIFFLAISTNIYGNICVKLEISDSNLSILYDVDGQLLLINNVEI